MALGYSAADWELLAVDLRRHAMDHDALAAELTEYGQKYEVGGRLEGPAAREADLVTVWIVLRGEDFQRFVTAFPGAKT